jgi:hypothetical protein
MAPAESKRWSCGDVDLNTMSPPGRLDREGAGTPYFRAYGCMYQHELKEKIIFVARNTLLLLQGFIGTV